ncbi:MAG: hypothetical protein COW92_05355, partial [Candidatus Omnitrophica bacterium CG22_combo_CG10-13_8_21_14_all_43_16]
MVFIAYPNLNKVLFEDFGEVHPDTLGKLGRVKETIEADTANLASINSYDFQSHEDLRGYLKDAREIQIFGEKIDNTEFNEEYSTILKSLVSGLPEDIKIILVEHNKGSPDSAERRLLFYDETTRRWIFSHAGTRKQTGKFVYLPKTAFLELIDSPSGREFLKNLIRDEMNHASSKLAGYWSEDYHKYEDNGLKSFVVDYLGDRLYPRHVRQIIHEISSISSRIVSLDSIISDMDKILNKAKTLDASGMVKLLEGAEAKLKWSKRNEKKEALEAILSVKKDLESGSSDKILSRLITARANLNRYLNILFSQINNLEYSLKRQAGQIKNTAYGAHRDYDPLFLSGVIGEFGSWNSGEGENAEPYDKIIRLYTIWYSRGERAPPELSFIYSLIKNEKIKELIKIIKTADKNFSNLSEYRKWKLVDSLIKESGLSEEDSALLRALTFSPRFYWRSKVPVEARGYICGLARQGRFGTDILEAGSRIEIDYKGDKSGDDWFLEVELDVLSRDETGKPLYWAKPPARELFRILSDFSGKPKSFFSRQWKQHKGQLYMEYKNYQETKILQQYVWGRDKQIYLIQWKDSSGNERAEAWKLTKDKLLNKPLAFTNGNILLRSLTAGILLAIGITGSYFGLDGLYYAALIPFIGMPETALSDNFQSWFNRLVRNIFNVSMSSIASDSDLRNYVTGGLIARTGPGSQTEDGYLFSTLIPGLPQLYQLFKKEKKPGLPYINKVEHMEDKDGNSAAVTIETLKRDDLEKAVELNNAIWNDSFSLSLSDAKKIFRNNERGHLAAKNENNEIIGIVWCASLYSRDIDSIPGSLKKIMSAKRTDKDNRWLHYAVAIRQDYQKRGLGPKIATELLEATEPLSVGMGRYTYSPMSGYGKYKDDMTPASYLMRLKPSKAGGGEQDYSDYKIEGMLSFREYLEKKGRSPTQITWGDYEGFKAQGGLSLEDYILQTNRSLECTAANLHVKNGAMIVRVIRNGREGDMNAGEAALITEYKKHSEIDASGLIIRELVHSVDKSGFANLIAEKRYAVHEIRSASGEIINYAALDKDGYPALILGRDKKRILGEYKWEGGKGEKRLIWARFINRKDGRIISVEEKSPIWDEHEYHLSIGGRDIGTFVFKVDSKGSKDNERFYDLSRGIEPDMRGIGIGKTVTNEIFVKWAYFESMRRGKEVPVTSSNTFSAPAAFILLDLGKNIKVNGRRSSRDELQRGIFHVYPQIPKEKVLQKGIVAGNTEPGGTRITQFEVDGSGNIRIDPEIPWLKVKLKKGRPYVIVDSRYKDAEPIGIRLDKACNIEIEPDPEWYNIKSDGTITASKEGGTSYVTGKAGKAIKRGRFGQILRNITASGSKGSLASNNNLIKFQDWVTTLWKSKILKEPVVIKEIKIKDDLAAKARDTFFTFKDYMDEAAFNSDWGYYARGKVRFEGTGTRRDFETFPIALSPVFGQLIATHAYNMWSVMKRRGQINSDEVFTMVEFGAGNGDLAHDVLSYAKDMAASGEREWDKFYQSLQYIIGERSLELAKRQKENNTGFKDKIKIIYCDAKNLFGSSEFKPGSLKGLMLSNELLDDLGAHKVRFDKEGKAQAALAIPTIDVNTLNEIQRSGLISAEELIERNEVLKKNLQLRETDEIYLSRQDFLRIKKVLSYADDQALYRLFNDKIKFVECYIDARHVLEVSRYLKENRYDIDSVLSQKREKRIVYINTEAPDYIRAAGEILDEGYVLTIDYGGDTPYILDPKAKQHLRMFGNGLKERNPYLRPGSFNITCDVDFSSLIKTGDLVGLKTIYYGAQSGLEEGIMDMRKDPGIQDKIVVEKLIRHIKRYSKKNEKEVEQDIEDLVKNKKDKDRIISLSKYMEDNKIAIVSIKELRMARKYVISGARFIAKNKEFEATVNIHNFFNKKDFKVLIQEKVKDGYGAESRLLLDESQTRIENIQLNI